MNFCVDVPVAGMFCVGSRFAQLNGQSVEVYHIGVLLFCVAVAAAAIMMFRSQS